MSPLQFTLGIALSPLEQLPELAKTAEECGFSSIALPDSLFYMKSAAAKYPYTADGSRFWGPETPWVDPLIGATAMAMATSRIRFYTNVLKLGSRNPLLLARQVGSVAAMSGNRFGFGVGIGWAPEEFEWWGGGEARPGGRGGGTGGGGGGAPPAPPATTMPAPCRYGNSTRCGPPAC
ncbi:LLM class flavin-dependent oxidoreductase, partial [Nocardia brasiliensis]|uniref:LLM class flavin-dependent oxidoreductase n=1 Tax=Nocardia brasiliensis TaxID=37326 RepID=UPI0024557742